MRDTDVGRVREDRKLIKDTTISVMRQGARQGPTIRCSHPQAPRQTRTEERPLVNRIQR